MAPLLQAVGIAVLLALLLNPLVHWTMRRLRVARTWAALLVFGASVLVLLVIPIAMGSLAVTQVSIAQLSALTADLAAAAAELRQWLLQPLDVFGYHLEPATLLDSMDNSLGTAVAALPLGSLNLLASISTNLLWSLTIFVMLYYFLRDGPRVKPWLLAHIPAGEQADFRVLLDRIEEIWGRFLRIQLLLFVVLGILFVLGTLLVVWLFRSGLVRWSPLGFVLLLLVVYTAVQQVDNLWLRPQYMGRQLQLHPGLVFVSLIAGLAFAGILGALVIVPILATARVVGRYLYDRIITPAPEPAARSQSPPSRRPTG